MHLSQQDLERCFSGIMLAGFAVARTNIIADFSIPFDTWGGALHEREVAAGLWCGAHLAGRPCTAGDTALVALEGRHWKKKQERESQYNNSLNWIRLYNWCDQLVLRTKWSPSETLSSSNRDDYSRLIP